MTGGQAVIKALEKEGTSILFGLPGVHVLEIYDALQDSEIRHILVRHEQSAAFMADAYSRVTGKVGVCLATTGPGATNTVTAIATAYCDSSPVLLITGQIPSSLIGKNKGALHEVDQLSIIKPLTKWNKCIRKVTDIPLTIHQAFKSMNIERPRPIQLEIPIDILEATDEIDFVSLKDVWEKPSGNAEAIKEAARLLANSRSPIILAGGGVLRSGASEEIITIADALSAPVITTIMGKGVIPEDNPLSLGCLARGGSIEEILAEADIVLALGTRFSATSTRNWKVKFPETLIHVDIDETEIGKNYAVKIGVVGDVKVVPQRMLHQLKKSIRTPRTEWLNRAMDIKRRMKSELEFSNRPEIRTVLEIRKILKRDAIVAADVTIPAYWMARIFETYQPGTFLYPAGYVAMGFGLPAAIASKIAYPERQVVAFCGDGSFMMTCQELATAVENNVNIPIVIYNNQGYGVLKYAQKIMFSSRYMGVDLTNPNFIRFAEAFGVKGLKVDGIDQLKSCLKEALKSDEPTVIETRLPFDPPWGIEHYQRKG
ncbi:MAG: thiamine pyrophosphate-binding protein [Candidatus Bathyarchaeia archaeon]